MATKRMFSKTITNSARFLKMPVDSQTLYFHLCMNADDDGIVEAYSVLKITGSNEDNLRVLAAKNFIRVLNDDLVTHITDWNEHNLIRADRKHDSIYKDLLLQIVPEVEIIEAKPRTDKQKQAGRTTDGQRTGNGQQMDGIGKVRLGKVRLGKDKDTVSDETLDAFEIFWNLYNHKHNKKKAIIEWKKVKPELYQTIYDHVRVYRSSERGKNFPYDPNNYLKDEHWNDMIISKGTHDNISTEDKLKRLEEMFNEI